MDDFDIIATAMLVNTVRFVLAVIAWFAILRFLDNLLGTPFTQAARKMNENSMALGIYYAARIIAVAHLVSAFLR